MTIGRVGNLRSRYISELAGSSLASIFSPISHTYAITTRVHISLPEERHYSWISIGIVALNGHEVIWVISVGYTAEILWVEPRYVDPKVSSVRAAVHIVHKLASSHNLAKLTAANTQRGWQLEVQPLITLVISSQGTTEHSRFS